MGFKYGVDIRNKLMVLAFLVADKAIKKSGELLIYNELYLCVGRVCIPRNNTYVNLYIYTVHLLHTYLFCAFLGIDIHINS